MRTNIEIDDELMSKVLKNSNIKTKKEAVEKGLELLLSLQNQSKIIALRGKIQFDEEAFK
ncbi:type II toxin-antitoxin system VapB family antitoxin [Mucilaginibacter glaciei]|uniref:Type II toxin-antitoxin system VapB family antitoxin n=1 Tax=Mucilaginibacter glaciei TaxID=2772109 RepID=A0A926NVQ2_9SPHI|nr:type II toxin-antitoxin system VapB family antitoxin [Mucilaginibacter glaciei]MBD1392599.1 type II toxin-antitoxin system VapB family antitoxin [Mucilaginibacter glaciei]